jgi:PAS domain S-box-containing protein
MNDIPDLSAREGQLLELAAAGLTDTAIANKLGISEATVSTYWGRIRSKIGPFSRTELVAKTIRRKSQEVVSALREENHRLSQQLKVEAGEAGGHNFYKQLIEHAADAILIVSKEGLIEMLNDTAADLFGWSPEELVGKHISTLLPDRYRMIHGMHIRNYISAPVKRTMGDHLATPALHRSGAEIQVAASLSAVTEGDDTSVICIVRAVERR